MLITESQIQEILEKNNLKEQIIPVDRQRCEVLSKQEIYMLKERSNFMIEAGTLQDNKSKFTLEFGIISHSVMKRFRGTYGIFNNVNFIDFTVEDSSLKDVNFINCTFRDTFFKSTKILNVNFINCTFESSKILDCDIREACFYHCIRDGLDFSNDIDSSNIAIYEEPEEMVDSSADEDEPDAFDELDEENDPGGNLPQIKQTYQILDTTIENKKIYQYKTITLKNFYKISALEDVIFANCEFILTNDLSRFIFKKCQFINCVVKDEYSIFVSNQFKGCSFNGVEVLKNILSCTFEKCMFNEFTASAGFNNCHFFHCEYDDKEKYIRLMRNSEISPSDKIERDINDERLLMLGYKNILMSVLKEMNNFAKTETDKQLIESVLNSARSIGSANDFRSDLITNIKKASPTIPGEDLKKLIVYLQDVLFTRIK